MSRDFLNQPCECEQCRLDRKMRSMRYELGKKPNYMRAIIYAFLLIWSITVIWIVATEGRHHVTLKIIGLCLVSVFAIFKLSREIE